MRVLLCNICLEHQQLPLVDDAFGTSELEGTCSDVGAGHAIPDYCNEGENEKLFASRIGRHVLPELLLDLSGKEDSLSHLDLDLRPVLFDGILMMRGFIAKPTTQIQVPSQLLVLNEWKGVATLPITARPLFNIVHRGTRFREVRLLPGDLCGLSI